MEFLSQTFASRPTPATFRRREQLVAGAWDASAIYPKTRRLLITANCGGINGARVRLWKVELQSLANQTGLAITVPSPARHQQVEQWNRIEHRLFAYITLRTGAASPMLSPQGDRAAHRRHHDNLRTDYRL